MLTSINRRFGLLGKRLSKEEGGFTLIELLIVLVIIGILLAIAVPSYMGFRKRANLRAAESNVRAAIPSAESYYETNNNYTGLTEGALRSIDSGLATGGTWVVTPGANSYTLRWTGSSGCYATATGPGGVVSGTCP